MNTKIKKFNEMYGPDGEEDRDSWPNAPKLDNLMGAQHGMQKVRDIYEAELQSLRSQVEAMLKDILSHIADYGYVHDKFKEQAAKHGITLP